MHNARILRAFWKRYRTNLTYSWCVFIICCWTLLRHITNGINFDVVGQVGVASQWSQGLHDGVTLGTTSYVLKIPLYMFADSISWLSPMNRLLVLALVCNMVAFSAIWVLIGRIMRLYGKPQPVLQSIAGLWLATIAGGMFWMDYANSRNIEIAGSLWLFYIVLRYIQKPSFRLAAGILILGSIVFFADPLQSYIYGCGVAFFAIWSLVVRKRQDIRGLILFGAAVAGALLLGKLLGIISAELLKVTYLHAPSVPVALNASTIPTVCRHILLATLTIFDAQIFKDSLGPNTVRGILNMSVLVIVVVTIARSLRHQTKQYSDASKLALCLIAANYILYIVSGQATQASTARYLVDVPLFTAILFIVGRATIPSLHERAGRWVVMVCALSGLLVIGGLAISWPQRHSKDQHIYQTVAYLTANHVDVALSSREIGVTTTYFSHHTDVLPLGCAHGKLFLDNLFYDSASFRRANVYTGEVPIIIPAGGLRFGDGVCDMQQIIQQFGKPSREDVLLGIGTIYFYQNNRIQPSLRYDQKN